MLKSLKPECTGCNACLAICDLGAITNKIDEYGFWYPQIDSNKCIRCKKCIQRCPLNKKQANGDNTYDTYIAWNSDDNIRLASSSGGIFSVIADYVIAHGGNVVGAAFDNDIKRVKHVMVNQYNNINILRKSKYIQSYISPNIFTSIKVALDEGKLILFSGTPCQVAGLNSFLQRNYNNLITIDVVCHGVPSPLSWEKYIEDIEYIWKDQVLQADFRAKVHGWKKFEMSLQMSEHKYSKYFNEDTYGKSFIHNMFLRRSCYKCKFKTFPRVADISLGDFWMASKKYDFDDKGCSLVICNTEKGKNTFNNINENIYFEEVSIEDAIPGNFSLIKSARYFKKRRRAFKAIQKTSFSQSVEFYTKEKMISKIKQSIRKVFDNE